MLDLDYMHFRNSSRPCRNECLPQKENIALFRVELSFAASEELSHRADFMDAAPSLTW